MPGKNILRISEYEKLYYDEAKPFQQRHWEALCRYQQAQKDGPELFRIINKGIQATSYVGAIQAGNLTIEILPKTDSRATIAANEITAPTDSNKQYWHSTLVQMLSECRLLNIHHAGNANLNLRNNSILDIYLHLFLAEAAQLLHEGLSKKYSIQEGNRSVLKGQLVFSQQVKNNIHHERFYTKSSSYENDNLFNRILHQTLSLIQRISTGNELTEKASRLLLLFPDVSNKPVAVESFNQLQFDRKTERYREAMHIAKMLHQNTRPDITSGPEQVIAILFDMNALWEEWVYRRLKKEETAFGIQVLRQQSTSFWETHHLSKAKSIRPDIVILQGDKTIVLDTKWKLPKNNIPGDDDLKQMFVYNLYWQCNEGILLYPAHEEIKTISGTYKPVATLGNQQFKCIVITTHVFNEQGKIDALFASKLLTNILTRSTI